MPVGSVATGWNIQVRARLRTRLDPRLMADLRALLEGSAGTPGSGRPAHPLTAYLPDAFACPLQDDACLSGPGFGMGLAYDGSRFSGLRGAQVVGGCLLLGVRARGLEREIVDARTGAEIGLGPSGLAALVDFLTRITDGPRGEVVGRMGTDRHAYGSPVMRCGDGRVRLVHTMGQAGPRGRPLPALIPVTYVEARDAAVADLDEDGLRDWLAGDADVAPPRRLT